MREGASIALACAMRGIGEEAVTRVLEFLRRNINLVQRQPCDASPPVVVLASSPPTGDMDPNANPDEDVLNLILFHPCSSSLGGLLDRHLLHPTL